MILLTHKPMLAALFSALGLYVTAPVQAQPSVPDVVPDAAQAQAFDTALQSYERCHWTLAFDQLVHLAERDHAPAARMAVQMHRYGLTLYGQTFVLSSQQAGRLAQVRLQMQTAQATRER